MHRGLLTKDGNTWYFDPADGKMQAGWVKIGESKFYFEPVTGALFKGMLSDGVGIKYCSPEDGHLMTGFVTIDGQMYYFDPATEYMLANTVIEAAGGVFAINEVGVVTQVQ